MASIAEFWKTQYEQQQLWHTWEGMTPPERESLVKDLLLHLNEETAEIQRLMDQSRYHILKRAPAPDRATVAEHGVDILKLTIALMLLGGVTSEDFEEAFIRKTEVVKAKWEWQRANLTNVEVLLCDIDGCIARWAQAFERWARKAGHVIEPGKYNAPHLEPIKDAFHADGGFTELEPVEDAIAVLNAWKGVSMRRMLVLVTARPYRRHRRIYGDTIEWCRKYNLEFDHILFETDKAEAVRAVQPAHVVGMIEDRGKHALEVASTGTMVIKLPYEAAEEHVEHEKIVHVDDWKDVHLVLAGMSEVRIYSDR